MNARLIDVLPGNLLNDEKIRTMAAAIDAELAKLTARTRLPLHLPRLDELPSKVLDELAWQFSAIFYQPEGMDVATKREIVGTAILQHRKSGTKFAVERLLNTLTRGARLKEWFEYGGEPYHFKINLQGLPDFGDDGDILMNAVMAAKNLRSWIDDFDFDLTRVPPDTLLHFAILQNFLSNLKFELNSDFEVRQRLKVLKSTVVSGHNSFGIERLTIIETSYVSRIITLEHGLIKYDAEFISEDDNWYRLWLAWVRSRWAKWRPAAVIYDEVEPDEELEPSILDQDFLRLWIDYHNSDHVRTLNIYEPLEDLTGEQINAVPIDGAFIYRKQFLSNRIIRACYIKKVITKVL